MYMFTVFLLNVNSSFFIRQLQLNFTNMFLSTYSSVGARLLLFIVGDIMISSGNPLDFRDKIFLLIKIFVHWFEH